MDGLETVAVGVAICAALALLAGLVALAARREWPALAGTHAHNDYRQRRPLLDALRRGYVSVEADVWLVDGKLLVGHDATDLEPWRSLRKLYLDPLAQRVEAYGGVFAGQTEPFQLLIEVKSDADETYAVLDEELRRYQHLLTRYEDGRIVPGAVSVVIAGQCPRATLAKQSLRFAGCDGSLGDVGGDAPASLVPLCSDKLAWRFKWRGQGPMPEHERALLRRLVAQAHEEGRRVRFWGVPTGPPRVRLAIWRELNAAGVDYLGADRLGTLTYFLRRAQRRTRR